MERLEGSSGEMNKRPELGSGVGHLDDRLGASAQGGQGVAIA
jgi:hypothetical protein